MTPVLQLLIFMSFAAVLRGTSASSAASVAAPKPQRRQHRNDKQTIEANIDLGERIVAFLTSTYDDAITEKVLEQVGKRVAGSQPSGIGNVVSIASDSEDDADAGKNVSLPYGFWRRFMEEEMRMQYSDRKRMQLYRSLTLYVGRKNGGSLTRAAMRGMRARNSCRSNGGALNARRAAGLGFALLQFFVDHVQRLRSRADSTMLMNEARALRSTLESEGCPAADLPKLDGAAGRMWFLRWRKFYGIVKKVTDMKLKVPWAKVKRRIKVFLGNIFRLRAFWDLCHPGTPMRFISLDQKPSWFNNAGHTGTFAHKGGSQPSVRENFAQTRERYSILTSVPSWGHTDEDDPPKIALLFRASPGGQVIQNLRKSICLKPWMKVQVQVNGSYRSEDVVEALDWMLPNATNSTESIVVLLDWYSGHLTEEVLNIVQSKGHVLLHHGGGCTPFTQINDTHLHALLARLLIQTENQWALEERKRLLAMGSNRTPKVNREDILSIVQTAWLSINHGRVAEKGYMQTGPSMPLTGSVAPSQVFGDLLRVMEELDASSIPTEVSMSLRDEAIAFVKKGFDEGKWTTWADCHKLIEQHEDGELIEEGMEAFSYDPYDGDEEAVEELDEEDEGDAVQPVPKEDDDENNEPASCPSDCDKSESASVHAHTPCIDVESGAAAEEPDPSEELAAARRVLYEEAVRTRDDKMARILRQQMQKETRDQKDASTEVGMLLKKRAQEQLLADNKRRKDAAQEERLAAKDLEETKAARARAEQAAAEARLASLRQIVVNRRDAEARRQAEALAAAQQKWLQTLYPAYVARRCIDSLRNTAGARKAYDKIIGDQLAARTFERQLFVKDLWIADKVYTTDWANVTPFGGGHRRQVRCGLPLMELIDKEAPRTMFGQDPVDTLHRLFGACIPRARSVFTGAYGPLRLLHINDYIMEKAFVYGIIALSKWLGKERFPQGVYGKWPPPFPSHLMPTLAHPVVTVTGDSDVPPHLRTGAPAASSGDAMPHG